MADKRFAVLIDSDNVSAKYIESILSELTTYGICTYKRIYGDWTSTQNNKWREKLLENAIIPIQQFSNTVGKNATDSTLIIDAMDILYAEKVDGFCIVSSDSDFTRLAGRLRESGMDVIGMGEKKTPESFVKACTRFIYLENLLDQDEENEEVIEDINDKVINDKITGSKNLIEKDITKRVPFDKSTKEKPTMDISKAENKQNIVGKKAVITDIVNIITENENKGKATGLGEIGSRLVKKYPDFDPRNYGYSLLSKFIDELPNIKLKKQNSTILVELEEDAMKRTEIDQYVIILVKKAGKNGIDLGLLGKEIREEYEYFNQKDYGYSTFSKYIQSIEEIKIKKNSQKGNTAFYVAD